MIKVYLKQPIEAEQFDGSNEMVKKYHIKFNDEYVLHFRIENLGKWVGIAVGMWIATDTNGEHWQIAEDVFKKTYAELPVIPKEVAGWIEKCKHDGTSVGDMLCYERQPEKVRDWIELTPGTYDFNQRRYTEHQELVACAWLYGYQVEEDK